MGSEAAAGGKQEIPAAEGGMYYSSNGYATPQYFYDYNSGGYAESPGVTSEQWEEYMRSMGMDNGEAQGQMFGYPGQPPFSPYGPGSPTMGVDGQLYGPQTGFQYAGQVFHQQLVSAGGQFLPPVATLHGGGRGEGGQQAGDPGLANGNGVSHEQTSGAMRQGGLPVALVPSPMAYGRMVAINPSLQDARFDNRMGQWPDSAKRNDGQQPGISAPMRIIHSQGMALRQLAPVQVMPRSAPNGFGRGRGMGHPLHDSRAGGRGWNGAYDKGRGRGRSGPIFSGNGTGMYDVATEQNRGPRTVRLRGQKAGTVTLPGGLDASDYNKTDFLTTYDAAKFFVIKSYSEDDVHKSIKYNVWASTPTGNKRLEAAYQEAQTAREDGKGSCPIFLLFSVNASGQFCGVAEMIGPVDHAKSVEYWQQDKWNGQFKVQWHVIKDVPNSQFRHIILPNNENKPVTNSRDTQEVSLDQGLQILEIFKNYAARTSILDDFSFYDDRQKTMQEKRTRQQQHQRQRQMMKQKPPGAPVGQETSVTNDPAAPEVEESVSGGAGSAPSEPPVAAGGVSPEESAIQAEPVVSIGEKKKVVEAVEQPRPEAKPSPQPAQGPDETKEAPESPGNAEVEHASGGDTLERRLQTLSVNT